MTAPIPDEAVEAAARAMAICEQYDGCFERLDGTDPDGEEPTDSDEEDAEWWRMRARAALTAAAPYIAAQATADLLARIEALRDEWLAAASGHHQHASSPDLTGTLNAVLGGMASSHANALDALLRGAK